MRDYHCRVVLLWYEWLRKILIPCKFATAMCTCRAKGNHWWARPKASPSNRYCYVKISTMHLVRIERYTMYSAVQSWSSDGSARCRTCCNLSSTYLRSDKSISWKDIHTLSMMSPRGLRVYCESGRVLCNKRQQRASGERGLLETVLITF